MPDLARDTLLHQLHASGLLDLLVADARFLFHKRLTFLPQTQGFSGGEGIQQVLRVGAIELGRLALPPCSDPERHHAFARWLGMASRDLGERLLALRPSEAKPMPQAVAQATCLMRERFGEALSLAEVARKVGLSREGLSRLFHGSLGITFSTYLNEIRLEEARRLLASSPQAIADIAQSCGFQSPSQFNRRFKSAVGLSPSQFRKQAATRPL